jgi:hypothetical protein
LLPDERQKRVRLYTSICAPGIGLSAGALAAYGFTSAMFRLVDHLGPHPSRLAVAALLHTVISLTGVSAGLLTILYVRWGERTPLPICRYYGWVVAGLGSMVMTVIFWRAALLSWPFMAADITFVILTGRLGYRTMSGARSTNSEQPASAD